MIKKKKRIPTAGLHMGSWEITPRVESSHPFRLLQPEKRQLAKSSHDPLSLVELLYKMRP